MVGHRKRGLRGHAYHRQVSHDLLHGHGSRHPVHHDLLQREVLHDHGSRHPVHHDLLQREVLHDHGSRHPVHHDLLPWMVRRDHENHPGRHRPVPENVLWTGRSDRLLGLSRRKVGQSPDWSRAARPLPPRVFRKISCRAPRHKGNHDAARLYSIRRQGPFQMCCIRRIGGQRIIASNWMKPRRDCRVSELRPRGRIIFVSAELVDSGGVCTVSGATTSPWCREVKPQFNVSGSVFGGSRDEAIFLSSSVGLHGLDFSNCVHGGRSTATRGGAAWPKG